MFLQNENEIKGLMSTMQANSKDIDMEFGIQKWSVSLLKEGKVINPSRSDPGQREKINLNFYFSTTF